MSQDAFQDEITKYKILPLDPAQQLVLLLQGDGYSIVWKNVAAYIIDYPYGTQFWPPLSGKTFLTNEGCPKSFTQPFLCLPWSTKLFLHLFYAATQLCTRENIYQDNDNAIVNSFVLGKIYFRITMIVDSYVLFGKIDVTSYRPELFFFGLPLNRSKDIVTYLCMSKQSQNLVVQAASCRSRFWQIFSGFFIAKIYIFILKL